MPTAKYFKRPGSPAMTFLCVIAAVLFFHSNAIAQQYVLGINVNETGGYGVQIASVDPGGPMTRMSSPYEASYHTAEPGDVIVAVNGMQTPTRPALSQALGTLGASNGQCNLSLRNIRTGQVEQWTVQAQLRTTTLRPPTPWPQPQPQPQPQPAQFDLGISGRFISSGFLITNIAPGGPATRVQNQWGQSGYLEINDVINTINGYPIYSETDYRNALAGLASTGGRAELGIIDINTGQMQPWTITATGGGGFNPNPWPDPNPNPWPDPNPNPNPGGIGRIHLLICGAPDQDVASSVNASLGGLNGIIQQQISPNLIASNTVLRDSNCSAQSILQAVDQLNPGPNDSVFMYYIGHGAFDDRVGGHFFDFSDYDLPRSEVQSRLRQKNARLTVLISESCHQESEAVVAFAPSMERTYQLDMSTPKTLELLLTRASGVVDVNSSSRGQLGFGNSSGGYFTVELLSLFRENNQNPNWRTVIDQAGQNANWEFQSMRSSQLQQFQQNPSSLNDPNKFRLKQALDAAGAAELRRGHS